MMWTSFNVAVVAGARRAQMARVRFIRGMVVHRVLLAYGGGKGCKLLECG